MKDEHVKDTAQDVAGDVTQCMAEDALGAAGDGGVKVFIVARATFQRRYGQVFPGVPHKAPPCS